MPFPWVATEASGLTLSPEWPYPAPPWHILGIEEAASVEEIKEAHRTMSKQCHPDVTGGSNDQQIMVNKARDEMMRLRGES
jgi:preprotein translocase subunit Sec63